MITYGNYLGNNYNQYPLEPIDDLDYACFLHDIDHKLAGGNNRFADRQLYDRLKKVSFIKLDLIGKLFYILARFLYSGFYAYFLRELPIFKKDKYEEFGKWTQSYHNRISKYKNDSSIWKKTFPKLF